MFPGEEACVRKLKEYRERGIVCTKQGNPTKKILKYTAADHIKIVFIDDLESGASVADYHP